MNRLGQQWEVDRTSLKPFPSGRATHGALDAILQLRAEFNLTRDQIKSIAVTAGKQRSKLHPATIIIHIVQIVFQLLSGVKL